jgi:prepilin-type N-terminal cleavage/methylation domain-containing protein
MGKIRQAFTLIEVLVSVALISVVVLGIMRIRQQNISAVHYLEGRMKDELANTLFLDRAVLKYRGDRRDALSVLHHLGVKKSKTRDILRKQERTIWVSEPLPIEEIPLPITLRAISLKKRYASRYYRILY